MELGANKVHMNLNKATISPLKRRPLPISVFLSRSKSFCDSEEEDSEECDNELSTHLRDGDVDYEDYDLTKLPNVVGSSSSSSSSISGREGDMPYSEVLRHLAFSNPYAGQTEIHGHILYEIFS